MKTISITMYHTYRYHYLDQTLCFHVWDIIYTLLIQKLYFQKQFNFFVKPLLDWLSMYVFIHICNSHLILWPCHVERINFAPQLGIQMFQFLPKKLNPIISESYFWFKSRMSLTHTHARRQSCFTSFIFYPQIKPDRLPRVMEYVLRYGMNAFQS